MFKILNGQCYVIDSNDMFKEQKTGKLASVWFFFCREIVRSSYNKWPVNKK
jgi:hypothetical protein